MKITIDTNEPLSPADIDILTDIVNRQTGRVVETTLTYDGPADPAEAEKAVQYHLREVQITKDEPDTASDEPEADTDAEDVPVTEEPEQGAYDVDGAPTRQDAIDIATRLMTQGHRHVVVDALSFTSASRVTELEGSDINVFIEHVGDGPKADSDE